MNEREIKFRYIWKRKSDGHFYVNIVPIECLELKGDQPFIHVEGNVDHWDLVSRDQFTGLKDKNGTEIYEGDVLHCDSPTHNCDLQVKFGTYGFEAHSHHGFYLETLEGAFEWPIRRLDLDRGDYKIIGNIYENPELLK